MSYGNYQQYGGNPYEGAPQQPGGYAAQSNPYQQQAAAPGGYGASDPYGTAPTSQQAPYTVGAPYGGQQPGAAPGAGTGGSAAGPAPTILSNQDFLARVEGTRSDIRQLTTNVGEIGTIHQRVLGSPDTTASSQLEHLVAQTQVLNTRIKDQIKYLETDAAKSNKNTTKDSQIRTLKQNFKSQLEDYQREEQTYRQRYRDQIARQYRIVNPDATETEVNEAANADWGDEGVFQTALRSNRSGAANSVLGSVRARHNDIQQIESTLMQLNQLFQDLAAAVAVQDEAIKQTEVATGNVKDDTEAGNKHLDKGIKSARNRRKLKWWCFFICVLIVVILALVLGLYFGLQKGVNSTNNNRRREITME